MLVPFSVRSLAVTAVVVCGGLFVSSSRPCAAQDVGERDVRILRSPAAITVVRGSATNRAVLGVVLAASSRGDSLGVRVESVEPNSPAAAAGLAAGDLITEINGISLRVSSIDLDDPALAGLAQRRLQRTMATVKPGDDVRLQVRQGAAVRTVTVTATSVAQLERANAPALEEQRRARVPGERIETRQRTVPRGMVGVRVGGTGHARDTLGLFISSVSSGGAADKAGLVEGERIAAVNGEDLRVPREDIDDVQAASARVDRFVRAVQKVEPGKPLALRVWSAGRVRDVTVTVEAISDAPRMSEPQWFEFERDGAHARVRLNGRQLEFDGDAMQRALEDMGQRLQERLREVEIDVRDLRGLPERSGAVRLAPRGRLIRPVVL
jgi:S1-C subfamily serine protease